MLGGDWHSIHRMKLVNGIELGMEEKSSTGMGTRNTTIKPPLSVEPE